MAATRAQATPRTLDALGLGPQVLTWSTIGAAWTIWISGWVLGTNGAYWGSLVLASALWSTSSAVDRLQLHDAVGADLASVLRAILLGGAAVSASLVINAPLEHLDAWGAVVATAAVAHLLAPWARAGTERAALSRSWNDLKAALGAAGTLIAAVMTLTTASWPVGLAITPSVFVQVLAGAAFCVAPTVLAVRDQR